MSVPAYRIALVLSLVALSLAVASVILALT